MPAPLDLTILQSTIRLDIEGKRIVQWSSHILALNFTILSSFNVVLFSLYSTWANTPFSQILLFIKGMETSRDEGNRMLNIPVMDEEGDDDKDSGEDNKKKRASSSSGRRAANAGGSTQRTCQVEDCTADMTDAKPYYRRHKVCGFHAKAPVVLIFGLQQRFCQQCSRFHELSEFDEAKRSCRRRLAGHNERRRKNSSESH